MASSPFPTTIATGARRLSAKSPIRHVDLPLLLTAIGLSALGAVSIFSATRAKQAAFGLDPNLFLKRQLIYIGIASLLFLLVLVFDYRQLRTLAPLIYSGGLLLLLAVLSPLGERVAGAQRWIDFGFFQLQPSEASKVVLVITLAAVYAQERVRPGPRRLATAVTLSVIPAFLIFLQPDLGTVMVLGAVLLGIVLLSATKVRWLLAMLALAVVMAGLAVSLGVLKDYQVARLTAFLDPQADGDRAGYNLSQSKIAIGAGGVSGKGLFNGSQTNLDYVPEQHTDFIFTVIGEEGGFIGAMLLIALFGFLIWRCIRIALLSRDVFGTLCAGGIAVMFAFQAFVNIGMTVGLMPITGVPLPFVSYGGSSLITGFIAMGLLMNIHMRRFV